MAHNPANPFTGIIEAKHVPHAKTLRTSLRQKFKDTFEVFAGNNFIAGVIANKQPHIGLYDYATLFIPMLLQIILPFSSYFFRPLRFVVSAVAMLISAPIVMLVHLFASGISSKTKQEALGVEVKKFDERQSSYLTLNDVLIENDLDVEDLSFSIQQIPSPAPEKSLSQDESEHSSQSRRGYQLTFWKRASAVTADGSINHSFTSLPYAIEMTANQKTGISALFKLNVGEIVSNIENSPSYSEKTHDKFIKTFTN